MNLDLGTLCILGVIVLVGLLILPRRLSRRKLNPLAN